MITSGLSHTDFRSREGLMGAYLKFSKRVEQHYRDAFGADSPQVRDCWNGVFAEPKVNLAVFEQMIAEQPNITLWKNRRVFGTRLSGDATGSSIGLVARIENDGRTALTVTADFYIDATYEGDLIAAAKVPYRVGREGHSEYNEPLAPEQEDAQLQAYNFRFTATQNSENRVMLQKPVQRGKNLHGQYFEAFPSHAVELDRVLDEALATKWIALTAKLGLADDTLPRADGKLTRGEWLRRIWKIKQSTSNYADESGRRASRSAGVRRYPNQHDLRISPCPHDLRVSNESDRQIVGPHILHQHQRGGL